MQKGDVFLFGTITPLTEELRVREYTAYRSVYCGLCKELKRRYGFFARFLLNYDLVLVALLADGLSGEDGGTRPERCMANPARPRPTAGETAGLALAADSLLLLSWHKLRDNLHDEKLGKKLLCAAALPFYHFHYRRAVQHRPELASVISAAIKAQSALEEAGCTSPDEAAAPTGDMLCALFAACAKGADRAAAARLGMFLGQIIYLLDAAEDFEKDAKNGSYNVYLSAGISRDEALRQAKEQCNMRAGEATLCYHLLVLRRYREIFDNVMYLGLPKAIAEVGCPKKKDNPSETHLELPLQKG